MTAGPTSTEAVRKSAIVPLAPDQAFEAFTSRIAAWWPLATHSVGLADAESVRFEGRLGGHIIESMADGTTSTWGTVTAWDPPHQVRFSWHPGSTEAHARKSRCGSAREMAVPSWSSCTPAGTGVPTEPMPAAPMTPGGTSCSGATSI